MYKLSTPDPGAMNWVIGSKEAFLDKLSEDIYQGLKPVEEEYTIEQLYARLEELQQEMKSLVRQGMKAGLVDEKEHSALGAEIERVHCASGGRSPAATSQLTRRKAWPFNRKTAV